jgi:hypothetical protein
MRIQYSTLNYKQQEDMTQEKDTAESEHQQGLHLLQMDQSSSEDNQDTATKKENPENANQQKKHARTSAPPMNLSRTAQKYLAKYIYKHQRLKK